MPSATVEQEFVRFRTEAIQARCFFAGTDIVEVDRLRGAAQHGKSVVSRMRHFVFDFVNVLGTSMLLMPGHSFMSLGAAQKWGSADDGPDGPELSEPRSTYHASTEKLGSMGLRSSAAETSASDTLGWHSR